MIFPTDAALLRSPDHNHVQQHDDRAKSSREAAAASLLSAWQEQLTALPPSSRSGVTVWRLSWSYPDLLGRVTATYALIGEDERVADPAFGHVVVPDERRQDLRWLDQEAHRALRLAPPDHPLVEPSSNGEDPIGEPLVSEVPDVGGEHESATANADLTARHSATRRSDNEPLRAKSLLRSSVSSDRTPAREGWRGRVVAYSGGLIKPRPGAAERDARLATAAIQCSLGRPVTIACINPKGGAGKTPTTLLTAATFGVHRGGGVAAWDCNETHGTLGLRALPDRPTTVWDLLGDLERFERNDARIGDLGRYLRPQGDAHFDVLASGEDPVNMAQIDGDACARIREVLCRFYNVVVIDTGNNMLAPNWNAVVRAADLLVVCSNYEQDRAYTAASMLDHLEATGSAEQVRSAVTVLSGRAPNGTTATWIEDHFTARTSAVAQIPYDPSMGVDTLTLDGLREPTRRAWLLAAGAMADALARSST